MNKYLITTQEAQMTGVKRASSSTFDAKDLQIQRLINEAIHILDSFGIPVKNKTARTLERMALAFLALCDVKSSSDWINAKSLSDEYALKTRDIIEYMNHHFGENISRGSYDDIRRQDLKHLILADLVITSQPQSARNDPKRAWAINPEYIELIKSYSQDDWETRVVQFFKDKSSLRQQLEGAKREWPRIPIQLPSGIKLEFGLGKHNQLQKAIIEEFLPRYGYGAKVIYIGDAENKFLYYDKAAANEIGLASLSHEELPDIIAYSKAKEWLYLIEAVHSSGPMSAERVMVLQPLVENCTASVIYVTAFLDRTIFKKFASKIAWETEVWIASSPEHIIHFDGEKFLGPYQSDIMVSQP